MVIGTAFGWGNVPTTILAIVLAFFFGYSLTLRGVLRAGVDFRTAFRVALAADTLSIAVMELIDNGVIVLWPDAMDAQLADLLSQFAHHHRAHRVHRAKTLGFSRSPRWPR